MHTCINPYLPKQTHFINTHGEITDGATVEWARKNGDRGEGRRGDEVGRRERDKTGDERKMGVKDEERKTGRRRRGGQRGESSLKSDSGGCARGPYSFTHELNGGMRVRER